MMELFYILTEVMDIGTYACDKNAKKYIHIHTHTHIHTTSASKTGEI